VVNEGILSDHEEQKFHRGACDQGILALVEGGIEIIPLQQIAQRRGLESSRMSQTLKANVGKRGWYRDLLEVGSAVASGDEDDAPDDGLHSHDRGEGHKPDETQLARKAVR